MKPLHEQTAGPTFDYSTLSNDDQVMISKIIVRVVEIAKHTSGGTAMIDVQTLFQDLCTVHCTNRRMNFYGMMLCPFNEQVMHDCAMVFCYIDRKTGLLPENVKLYWQKENPRVDGTDIANPGNLVIQ